MRYSKDHPGVTGVVTQKEHGKGNREDGKVPVPNDCPCHRPRIHLHEMKRPGPIPDSYWLVVDLLLAGEYPGAEQDDRARTKLTKFLDAGIRTFIDLTESSEPLAKYD